MPVEKQPGTLLAIRCCTPLSFAEKAFSYFNLDLYKYLNILEELKRPQEVPHLLGDSTKIRKILGWKPIYNFDKLIEAMCKNDYEIARKEIK